MITTISDWLTVQDAADTAKVTKALINRLKRDKRLMSAKVGKLTLINAQSLQEWIAEPSNHRRGRKAK